MTEKPPPPTREQRLAARLRENLRRRKQQARALEPKPYQPESEPDSLPKQPEGR